MDINLLNQIIVYIKRNTKGEIVAILILYVDDILYSGTKEEIKILEEALKNKFKLKTTDELESYIGVQIRKSEKDIYLSLQNYILKAVKHFEIEDLKFRKVPLTTYEENNQSENYLNNVTKYQSIVGVLNYISNSLRFDIAYAVNWLSRRTSRATVYDFKTAKRTLAYLRDHELEIKFNKIKINSEEKVSIVSYVDASFGNAEDATSICGYFTLINGNMLQAKCKKQKNVALTSTEAEFIAIALCCKEVLWIMNLFDELRIKYDVPIIYSDNQPAIRIASAKSAKGRTRHINIKYQFVRQLVKEEKIKIKYVSTENNIADILTKALSEARFSHLMNKVNETLKNLKNA